MMRDSDKGAPNAAWIKLLQWKMDRMGLSEQAQAIAMDLIGADGRTYTSEEICEKHGVSEKDVEWVARRLLGTACSPGRRFKDYNA